MSIDLLPPIAAARAGLQAQQRIVRDAAKQQIEEIEAARNSQLRQLENAIASLSEGEQGEERPRPTTGKRPRKATGKSPASTTPKDVRKRREAVFRYLVERGHEPGRGQICRDLDMTPDTVTTATKQLCKEGRIKRLGSGRATRYKATVSAARSARAGSSRPSGTVPGLIVTTVRDRGYATLEELVQATGAPRDEVLRQCGILVAEEEIQMDRRDGRAVYIPCERP